MATSSPPPSQPRRRPSAVTSLVLGHSIDSIQTQRMKRWANMSPHTNANTNPADRGFQAICASLGGHASAVPAFLPCPEARLAGKYLIARRVPMHVTILCNTSCGNYPASTRRTLRSGPIHRGGFTECQESPHECGRNGRFPSGATSACIGLARNPCRYRRSLKPGRRFREPSEEG